MFKRKVILLSILTLLEAIIFYNYISTVDSLLRWAMVVIYIVTNICNIYFIFLLMVKKHGKKALVTMLVIESMVFVLIFAGFYSRGIIFVEGDTPIETYSQVYKKIDDANLGRIVTKESDIEDKTAERLENKVEYYLMKHYNLDTELFGTWHFKLLDSTSNTDGEYYLVETNMTSDNYAWKIIKSNADGSVDKVTEIKKELNTINDGTVNFIDNNSDELFYYETDCDENKCNNTVYSINDNLEVKEQFVVEEQEIQSAVFSNDYFYLSVVDNESNDNLRINKYDMNGNINIFEVDYAIRNEDEVLKSFININGEKIYLFTANFERKCCDEEDTHESLIIVYDLELNQIDKIAFESTKELYYVISENKYGQINIIKKGDLYFMNSKYNSIKIEDTKENAYYNMNESGLLNNIVDINNNSEYQYVGIFTILTTYLIIIYLSLFIIDSFKYDYTD